MRLNKYLADNTELSRRKADTAIENGRVKVNGDVAMLGTVVAAGDTIYLDGQPVESTNDGNQVTILLNKPVGYVCSKNGQGSPTVYELLPDDYQGLNIAGRLDKDSSGLVILTNDGVLLNELTHPSSNKEKIYRVTIDRELTPDDIAKPVKGVDIGDERPSKFKNLKKIDCLTYEVVMEEGRNRQIRRSFEAVNYKVTQLHREQLGRYRLGKLKEKEFIVL
jgi:pseudouridine synthase